MGGAFVLAGVVVALTEEHRWLDYLYEAISDVVFVLESFPVGNLITVLMHPSSSSVSWV